MKALFVVVGILATAVAVDQVFVDKDGFRTAKACGLQSQQPTGIRRGLPPLARGPQRQPRPFPPSTGSFLNTGGLIGRTGRSRRQAGKFDPTNTPFRWYKADVSINSRADCETEEFRHGAIRGPVVVPRGKYDVCVKFDTASTWFRTSGSNGNCNPDGKCCDWFPPSQCNNRIAVLKWFPLPDGFSACKDVPGAKNAEAAAEYLSNASPNQQRKICVKKVAENEGDPVDFILDEVIVTHCFHGCCIFKRKQESR